MHFKTAISKIHLKIAPSQNAFQNFYVSTIVIKRAKTKLAVFLSKY